MLDLFRQATKDALSLLGEGSFLRGTIPCHVNVEHGVQMTGMDTAFETVRDARSAVTSRSVATIEASLNPKRNDALTVDGENYLLDALLEDTGAFKRFTLLKVA